MTPLTMYLWAFHFLNKGQNENFVENVCQDDSFFDGLLIFQDFLKLGDFISASVASLSKYKIFKKDVHGGRVW